MKSCNWFHSIGSKSALFGFYNRQNSKVGFIWMNKGDSRKYSIVRKYILMGISHISNTHPSIYTPINNGTKRLQAVTADKRNIVQNKMYIGAQGWWKGISKKKNLANRCWRSRCLNTWRLKGTLETAERNWPEPEHRNSQNTTGLKQEVKVMPVWIVTIQKAVKTVSIKWI